MEMGCGNRNRIHGKPFFQVLWLRLLGLGSLESGSFSCFCLFLLFPVAGALLSMMGILQTYAWICVSVCMLLCVFGILLCSLRHE